MKENYNPALVNRVFKHLCMAYSKLENQPTKEKEYTQVRRHGASIQNELFRIEDELKEAINNKPEEDSYAKILEKINSMDRKINQYIDNKSSREQRWKSLEEKIRRSSTKSNSEMIMIEKNLEALEERYAELSKSLGGNDERIQKIKSTIDVTKKKIKKKKTKT